MTRALRLAAIALATATIGVASIAQGAPASRAQQAPPQLERVIVRGDAVDNPQLVHKLGLRRPDLTFETGTGPRPPDAAELLVTSSPGKLQLELTAADERRYTREIPADRDIGTRAVAGDVAAFLDAVEHGTVAPEPATRSRSRAKRTDEVGRGEQLLRELELGAGFGPSVTVPVAGLAAVQAGTFVSGAVNLRAQSLDGILVDVGIRVGAKRAAGNRLRRTRVTLGGGYRLTRGAFEMPVIVGLTIEPWSVATRVNDAPRLRADGVELALPPSMVGLAARASPAYQFTLPNGIAVRVGGGLELAMSTVPGVGLGAVGATQGDSDTPELRVGGVETSILLEVGVWAPWGAIRRK